MKPETEQQMEEYERLERERTKTEVCHICGAADPQYGCDPCGEPTCEDCGAGFGIDFWGCNVCLRIDE